MTWHINCVNVAVSMFLKEIRKKNLLRRSILVLSFISIFFLLPQLTLGANWRSSVKPSSTPTPRYSRPTAKFILKPTLTPTPTITQNNSAQSLLFGAVVEDYSNATGQITSLSDQVGTKVSTISIFKQFGNQYNKNLDQLQYASSQKMRVQIAWEPWNPEQGMRQSTDYLKQIPTGMHDTYLRSFASSIKAYNGPVLLRFGHEMNGDWYPWGKRPTEYKVAYRYIHDFFIKEGVTNVKWTWVVNITENPSELPAYYPGDDVVDLIGIDGFNFGTSQDYGGWRSFEELFLPTYQYLSNKYLSKQIFISETASAESGGDKGAWIREMFAVLPTKFPKVHELIWFNLLKEADWRTNSSTSSLQAFKDNL